MSSKVGRKKKSSAERLERRSELKERNQKLKKQLETMLRQTNIMEKFSKWRLVTYAWIVFLPPYGLYRVWSKESTFTFPEKAVWTFMTTIYMLRFLWIILFA